MKREQYINFRLSNDINSILYYFLLENKYENINNPQVKSYLILFFQRLAPDLREYYINKVVEHYDYKFKVVLVLIEEEVIDRMTGQKVKFEKMLKIL